MSLKGIVQKIAWVDVNKNGSYRIRDCNQNKEET